MNKELDQIAKFAYSTKDTVLFTYLTACSLIRNKVQGYFVECGVGAGAQIAAMLLAQRDMKEDFIVWGFDSFQGIPMAGPHDAEQPGIGAIKHDVNTAERDRLVSSGITVHSEVNVRNNIKSVGLSMEWLMLVPGWFQDTIHKYTHRMGKIALLRLDGDLYESTMVCLEQLYDKVVEGGVVIIDDYGLEGCRKAVHSFFIDRKIDHELLDVQGSGSVKYFVK